MRKTYSYDGPIELGSVVAHQCAGAQLFVTKDIGEVLLRGKEIEDKYELKLWLEGGAGCTYTLGRIFTGPVSVEGRKQIGRELLIYLRDLQGLPESPWGTLVGVRPTKLVHKLWDTLGSLDAVELELKKTYSLSEDKWNLLSQVVQVERPYVAEVSPKSISIYSGIPFCESHCSYCSFPYGMIQNYPHIDDFTKAYQHDIEHMRGLIDRHALDVADLYMGGGTPTSLKNEDFRAILRALATLVPEEREFTVEAGRPDSVTPDKLSAMMEYGVNRISINPQTMDDGILRRIGRGHSVQDIVDLYSYIHQHTDLIVNMDFIAGLPYQSIAHMEDNLAHIEQMLPHNVTVHTLALKKGSPLYDSCDKEAVPSEEMVLEMLAMSHDKLLSLGYVPYYMYRQQYMVGQMENVGYTLPGYACSYNIRMMEERHSILAMGPGSSSKWMSGADFRQHKQHMPKDVDTYCMNLDELLEKRSKLSDQCWRDS